MLVKDLIQLFTQTTRYKIKWVDNPHYIEWSGQGNKINTTVDNKIIKGIQHNSKEIVIYI